MKISFGAAAMLVVVVTLSPGPTSVAPSELLGDVRDGDLARVGELLRQGADPNARDESGATALMHAAAYASPDMTGLLLDHGADPVLADGKGATPLMWATSDIATVRLLLQAGADVNASRGDGMTALVSAALRGRPDVMRMLLAAGADRERGAVMAPWRMALPAVVFTSNDPAMREFANPEDLTRDRLQRWTPPPMTIWFLTRTFSWRPQPADIGADALRLLLDAGMDANDVIGHAALRVPALAQVVRVGDLYATRLLLDRGADPNLAGVRGLTPLMLAAAGEGGAPAIRLLLDRGASVDAVDLAGQTALDWALKAGESDASRLLRQAGAVTRATARPVPPAVSHPRSPLEAVGLAIARLQPAGPPLHEKAGCISCHQQSLPSVAVALARARGVPVDAELATHSTRATLESWGRSRDQLLVGNCAIFGFIGNVTYGLFGLAEDRVAPGPVTDAVVSCLSGLQKPDGRWEGADIRPPLAGREPIVYTALALRGLDTYGVPGRRAATASRLERALAYLMRATPQDTQDEAFRLLGLVWGGAPAEAIAGQAARVRAAQRNDGGWGQLPAMPPDAYATGQALYALRVAGMAASDDTYRRGAAFLLRTQRQDGTWFVRSRAIGIQPYLETGFPHGPDQFISSAASAWAVMALSHVL